METQTEQGRKSLVAICEKGLSLIITLGSRSNLGGFEALRARVTAVFNEIEQKALAEGYIAEDARMARYALTAFVDETIARTDWEGKNEWLSNPLSLADFGDNTAGDGFFDRLTGFRSQADSKADLLEVYYYCVGLGFEGKYALSDPQERRDVLELSGRDLERVRPMSPVLSPSWKPPEAMGGLVSGGLPLGIIGAIAAGIVFVVFIVLNLLLNGRAKEVAETIQLIS